MKVEFLKQFSRDLDSITSLLVKKRVKNLILRIEATDNLSGIPDTKKLKGHRNAFRIRLGDYRLGIFLIKDTIVFARILNRKDIYDSFP